MKTKHTNKNSLASKYQQTLRNQVIDENQPGMILQDFEIFLNFVRDIAPLKVTQKNTLLPGKLLEPLNAQLPRPLKVDLKRPQPKSYPNIFGLYLLLRATGIVYIQGGGTNQQLVIDDAVLHSWRNLNPTERYFTLLETWLYKTHPEVLGEYEIRGFFDTPLYKWPDFFQRIPDCGMNIAGDRETEDMIKFLPGHYTLTLLEMFGFITIHDDEPEPGRGWRILSVQKTSFGEAMLQVLSEHVPTLDDVSIFRKRKTDNAFGGIQPTLQPFFPEWQNNLMIPKPEIQAGTYIFKVSVWKAWRRIAIPGDLSLDWLSSAILNAFNFDHDHLYSFIYKDRFGVEHKIHHPYLEQQPFTDEVSVQEVPLPPGASMIFFYDYGDCWEFNVQLEQIEPVDPNLRKPKILEKHGKAPKQYRLW